MEFYTKPGDYDPINYVPHAESHGTSELWKTFWILLGITILDFVIYFVMGPSGFRNFIFLRFGESLLYRWGFHAHEIRKGEFGSNHFGAYHFYHWFDYGLALRRQCNRSD